MAFGAKNPFAVLADEELMHAFDKKEELERWRAEALKELEKAAKARERREQAMQYGRMIKERESKLAGYEGKDWEKRYQTFLLEHLELIDANYEQSAQPDHQTQHQPLQKLDETDKEAATSPAIPKPRPASKPAPVSEQESAPKATPNPPGPVIAQNTTADEHQTPLVVHSTPHPADSGKPSHRRRRDVSLHIAVPDPPSPAPPTPTLVDADITLSTPIPSCQPPPQPREIFLFSSPKTYAIARAVFPITSEPNHPAQLRWNALVKFLQDEPVGCELYRPNDGVEWKVVRPARRAVGSDHPEYWVGRASGFTGSDMRVLQGGKKEDAASSEEWEEAKGVYVEKRSVVIHAPHGNGQTWVQRHMLDNVGEALARTFGWERGDFILE